MRLVAVRRRKAEALGYLEALTCSMCGGKLLGMNPLVSTTWVADRLGAPEMVLLDATLPPVGVTPGVDVRARYLERHLPGAVFFDIDELSDATSGLPHTLPTAEAFSRSMEALGVGREATLVVYEQDGVFSAPRAWWMLRTFGAERVFVLDGGLRAWGEAGLPVERGAVRREAARFEAELAPGVVVDFAELQATLAAGGQVLDARPAGRFAGTAPEPRPGLSSGHMPGASSLPFTELVSDGRLRPVEELARVFAERGVDPERTVTTSCGSGVTAAVLALGLELCGAKKVRLYDGSWAEYAQRPGAVIVKGEV
jgi:thiosulfate/3-mercaptopyruvate sulfurtransferase